MILLSLLIACSGKEPSVETQSIDTAVEMDSGTTDTSQEETNEDCIDVPTITYASFGQGFITFSCQGCHGTGSADRQGAPESVTFDNHEQALQWLPRIYQRTYVTLDMPPALGIFDEDLERLRIWVECWDGQ